MNFRQASWGEPLIFELSKPGKIGWLPPRLAEEELKILEVALASMPEKLKRKSPPKLPEVSEVEVIRHYSRLTHESYGVDFGAYPLGSCTMKYSPKFTNITGNEEKIKWLHPYEDARLTQGILKILYELSRFLEEITGMDKFTLQPSAGAHGEFTGALIIRAYHRLSGEIDKRDEMIIPDTAHGTNPASASMAGFKVVTVPSDEEGLVDMEALKYVAGERTAGLMLTNPNTLGLFEKEILEITKLIHEVGGLVYYDGANLNAILGKARPGDMGFDIAHVNLHKTFSTPHGGGGPGGGPVGVKEKLAEFLPIPTIEFNGEKYYLDYNRPHSIGKVRAFYGNISVLIRAYSYILALGGEGLRKVAELSVLHSNYVMHRIIKARGYALPYDVKQPRKHEFVVSAEQMSRETGVTAIDIAKRLLDKGVHPPTIYFPLTVKEALMIEPTETESEEALRSLAEAFLEISEEAYNKPEILKGAPSNTTVDRVDEISASHPRTMCLSWRMMRSG
ncbi:MAG: aminomethyl-transferring glycine dehydrogenase subunit GcvPB [Candidatus Bathyarchaeia archaeon]|nr:aminomethyl-transferring glycine dehydrogenase subunit GcvPB [Candidatus Bathyarchaeota archaeon]